MSLWQCHCRARPRLKASAQAPHCPLTVPLSAVPADRLPLVCSRDTETEMEAGATAAEKLGTQHHSTEGDDTYLHCIIFLLSLSLSAVFLSLCLYLSIYLPQSHSCLTPVLFPLSLTVLMSLSVSLFVCLSLCLTPGTTFSFKQDYIGLTVPGFKANTAPRWRKIALTFEID